MEVEAQKIGRTKVKVGVGKTRIRKSEYLGVEI